MTLRSGPNWVSFRRGTARQVVRANDATLDLVHADGVVERYEQVANGVEQSFVFAMPYRRSK